MSGPTAAANDDAVLIAEGLVPAGLALPLTHALAAGRLTCLCGIDPGRRTAYLRALAAVDPPASGRLDWHGVDITRLSRRDWRALRRQIAYVAPGAPLLSVLGGLANVTLPALYHGLGDTVTVTAWAEALLAKAGFTGDPKRLPAFISPLEQRQLAICRGLILAPEVLFIDAPFAGLEPEASEVLADYLIRLKAEGLGLILAANEVQYLASAIDEILFLGQTEIKTLAGLPALGTQTDPEIEAFRSKRGL